MRFPAIHIYCSYSELLRNLFYVQGTNAHILLGKTPISMGVHNSRTNVPWRRKRTWFAPSGHVMLFVCTHVARGVLELHSDVNRAAVAYLWDHQVSL